MPSFLFGTHRRGAEWVVIQPCWSLVADTHCEWSHFNVYSCSCSHCPQISCWSVTAIQLWLGLRHTASTTHLYHLANCFQPWSRPIQWKFQTGSIITALLVFQNLIPECGPIQPRLEFQAFDCYTNSLYVWHKTQMDRQLERNLCSTNEPQQSCWSGKACFKPCTTSNALQVPSSTLQAS